MRLAWFSPLPPHRSGIAAYSADLLPALARTHQVDAYVDDGPTGRTAETPLPIPGISVRGTFDFAPSHAQRPYDVVVYQLGNDACHDYMWPYLLAYPGLVVMHDGQLHQSRARSLLAQHRAADYLAEFQYSHPGVGSGVPRVVEAGIGSAFYYLWPMVRVPVESARLVAGHTPWLATRLAEERPEVPVTRIRMGVPDPLPLATDTSEALRARHGIPHDAVVLAAFGRVTPEKGLTQAVMALAQLGPRAAPVHLLLVGETVPYYDVVREAWDAGVGDRIHVTGYVTDDRLPSYLAAADACLCLRWPTAHETSASWLRCVAAGKATIMHDLAHTRDIPALDPRTGALSAAVAGVQSDPLAIGIDLMDETSTLRLALEQLGHDTALRQRLGAAARRYWASTATVDLMADDYERALKQAAALPERQAPRDWPAHLTADGTGLARTLAAAVDAGRAASMVAAALGHGDRAGHRPGD